MKITLKSRTRTVRDTQYSDSGLQGRGCSGENREGWKYKDEKTRLKGKGLRRVF